MARKPLETGDITGSKDYRKFLSVLSDVEMRIPITVACEKHGFDRTRFYRWQRILNESAGGLVPPGTNDADPRIASARTESLARA